MRSFLNSILAFIGAESLTDEEFDTVESSSPEYNQATYDDLSRVLESRDAVSNMHERLGAYYKAKGVTIAENDTGKTNIWIGSAL